MAPCARAETPDPVSGEVRPVEKGATQLLFGSRVVLIDRIALCPLAGGPRGAVDGVRRPGVGRGVGGRGIEGSHGGLGQFVRWSRSWLSEAAER